MTENHPHIIPEIEKWPINRMYQSRGVLVDDMIEYTLRKLTQNKSEEDLATLAASTIYNEKIRTKTNPWKVDPPNEIQYWKKLEKEVEAIADKDNRSELYTAVLRKIINRYAQEIAGNFNPSTFRFARKALTFLFKRLYNQGKEKGSIRPWGTKKQVAEKIKFYGQIETVRKLFDKGTVVIVPNHFSNLDSILMGYAIDTKVGIPAFSYGAGLNLYDYELVAYYINRLGAYKLDRRKKNPVYLATLKAFSTVSIQKGVNTLFYPGGTRSRSGEFEKYIKLGLFGTMMEAQRNLCLEGREEKIFVVPMTVGYHFTLEAKSLIQQHLSKEGKERFVKDKSTGIGIRSIVRMIRKMWKHPSEVLFNFGQPMDVFGNRVDIDGHSYDERNVKLDILDYYKAQGQLTIDEQRESRYTSKLGKRILEAFVKENIILESHLLAFVAFWYLRKENQKLDLYSFLRLPKTEWQIDEQIFTQLLQEARTYCLELEEQGKVKCGDAFQLPLDNFTQRGLQYLGSYHTLKVLTLKKSAFISEDLKLLYYYHNHLLGYNIGQVLQAIYLSKRA